MTNNFSHRLISFFEEFPTDLLFVKNPDMFLHRDDIKNILGENGIRVVEKSGILLRVDFEINYKKEPQRTIYLSDNLDLPEDLLNQGIEIVFLLKDIFPELHNNSIIGLPLNDLEILFDSRPENSLNKKDTELLINSIFTKNRPITSTFDFPSFEKKIIELTQAEEINWLSVIELISEGISKTIGNPEFDQVKELVEICNHYFQRERGQNYQQIITSSHVKKPRIVSSILKFLSHHYLESKAALIVIDGMTYWQYLLLRDVLRIQMTIESDFIYSWIPSITQLSRQAIFKGDFPSREYIQNPKNEEKLWRDYWSRNGVPEHELFYSYNDFHFNNLEKVSKYAAVFSGLDDKMHSSTDYVDLKSLTINWIKKSGIIQGIQTLLDTGFDVFLTTDHGNVPAQGWRNLKDNEKLGTVKSGSRSARHLYYSEKWLAQSFIESNPDLSGSVSLDDSGIFFTDLKSFSHQKELVTHGGSHLLEVIIPFSKIRNGS